MMYTPIEMKRSMKYGNNYWETYSPKIGRNVRFFSDLEYENWLHIETNPEIIDFCEQPLKIQCFVEGNLVESIFDMWVQYKDNTEEFMEVKYAIELAPDNSKSLRSKRQIEVQRQWCIEHQYNYSVRTDIEIRTSLTNLNNLKQIIGQVRTMPQMNIKEFLPIVHLLSKSSLSIAELIKMTDYTVPYMIQIICLLVYKGICRIINTEIELSLETEVELIGSKESIRKCKLPTRA